MQIKNAFPDLLDPLKKKTSEVDSRYNCIAWAFKDNRRHWWPNPKYSYWPIDMTGQSELEAFEAWFQIDGWEQDASEELEAGFEKIALYTLEGQPTHAARQLSNGLWTSKLGENIDLAHDLRELNGPQYGSVLKIYRKRI